MNGHGYVRIAAISPKVSVGCPTDNFNAFIAEMKGLNADIVVFPELFATGYTCGDLFKQRVLLEQAEMAVQSIAGESTLFPGMIVFGAPVPVGNGLYNCAVVVERGSVLGIVPKTHLPNYNEFYESRHFRGASGSEPKEINYAGQRSVPFGTDILFKARYGGHEAVVGIEICEDLWMPIPPSSHQALAGANILINLSASNETVAKNEYRTELVKQQSGRCIAAYVYSSAGRSESTTDLVFGGHCIVAENGSVLIQSSRVGDPSSPIGADRQSVITDVDVEKLQSERRATTSFGEASKTAMAFRTIEFKGLRPHTGLQRIVPGMPFVPSNKATLSNRCAELFGIQAAGLYGRLEKLKWPDVRIGISGGLDSTLAAVVTAMAFAEKRLSLKHINGITMPGFGTTDKTKSNAVEFMRSLGISRSTIDIRPACVEIFCGMRHDPFKCGWLGRVNAAEEGPIRSAFGPTVAAKVRMLEESLGALPADHKMEDLVFENVQARVRTNYLLNGGFTIGTGDMSEAALGWCTYAGDHISNYNPNCSIPKTVVKFMIEWVAENLSAECLNKLGDAAFMSAGTESGADNKILKKVLLDIAGTTISPELLPKGKDGAITQSTEDLVGPYELNDFFLFHLVRNGFSPAKILMLAEYASFGKPYKKDFVKAALQAFIKRFFSQQFKRSCVPDGPKVGSVSLSPRGDWRMPSDASSAAWLENAANIFSL